MTSNKATLQMTQKLATMSKPHTTKSICMYILVVLIGLSVKQVKACYYILLGLRQIVFKSEKMGPSVLKIKFYNFCKNNLVGLTVNLIFFCHWMVI